LKTGDHIVINRVGAYNMTQWMQFITLRPDIIMIDMDGKPFVVRKKESIETILSQEVVPPHLQ
jgi:diaminopimelate decarboxylase